MATRNALKAQLNVTIDKTLVDTLREFHADAGKSLAAIVSDALVEYIQNHDSGQAKKITVFRTSTDKKLATEAEDLAAQVQKGQ